MALRVGGYAARWTLGASAVGAVMSGGELLLELLSEEIPARMQRRAIEDLTGLIRDKLSAAEIPAAELRGTVTPRRLTVIAGGIPERQPDRSEERRGPRVGAPQQALDGFLRAAGLSSIEQCEVRDTGRGEFYFAIVQHAGRPAAQVLPELLQAAIAELPWPKSMRFPAAPLRWVRPLTSVLCLFGGEVLPLSLGDVPVGRTTCGHRFLSPGEIAIDNAADYAAKLEAAHVMLDQDRRRDLIAAGLDRLAQKEGVKVKPDPGLLDEVTGLAEFPVVLMGTIDDASMALPPEVLATAMRTHQKYFTCLKSDGSPAPRFLFVANNLTPDDGKTIVAGNERVLRARQRRWVSSPPSRTNSNRKGFPVSSSSATSAPSPRNHIDGAIAAIARPPSNGTTGTRLMRLRMLRPFKGLSCTVRAPTTWLRLAFSD